MKLATSFAVLISIIGLLAYAAYSNNEMYSEIDRKFSSEPIFKQSIGDFQRATLVHSGNDCEYADDADCFENNLMFKVVGTRGCIYAEAIVKESFPVYRLIAVAPSTYVFQNTTNGITDAPATRIRECRTKTTSTAN